MFDSHAHLHDAAFADDVDEVIRRAREAGVERIITVGTSIAASRAAIVLAEQHAEVYATAGIAPHDEQPFTAETVQVLRQLAQHPKVVALGECGLDYHYDTWARDEQQRIFRAQLALASELGKPVVIHNRDADHDLLAVLREFAQHSTLSTSPCATLQSSVGTLMRAAQGMDSALSTEHRRGVMHCFSSTLAMAEQCVALGFMISIAGPVTYPKPRALPEIVRTLPLDTLLIETDAPYLAPQSQRGKRNEPAYVREVAQKIAELRGESSATVAHATARNAERLFGLTASAE